MEEELENGIALMEGILQNWENGNKDVQKKMIKM